MKPAEIDRKEVASGVFFMGVGLVYGGIALRDLPLGTSMNMGPGYFPVMLCIVLFLIGAAVAIRGFTSGAGEPFGVIPWRGASLLIAAIAVFATFIDEIGLVPAVFVTAFLAASSLRSLSWVATMATSAALSLLSTIIFIYGVGLPIRPFGYLF